MTDKEKSRLLLRNLAAKAFWRSRRQESDWAEGYWLGLFKGYQFSSTLIDLSK